MNPAPTTRRDRRRGDPRGPSPLTRCLLTGRWALRALVVLLRVGLLTSLLNKYLGDFVEGLDSEQLKLGSAGSEHRRDQSAAGSAAACAALLTPRDVCCVPP